MPGAQHIDFAYSGHLADGVPGVRDQWIILHKLGSVSSQESPEWTALKLGIAEVIDAALRAV